MSQSWKSYMQSLSGVTGQPPHSSPLRVARFGDPHKEYHALGDGAALVDRSNRVLLEAAGVDRVSWLHNLTSNQVKMLGVGDGNYAFCLNVQGRILFDLNVLVGEESIGIDLEESFCPRATAHFEKYKIIEDVTLVDRSAEFVRIGFVGKLVPEVLNRWSTAHIANLPLLGCARMAWNDQTIRAVRTDFCGPFGLEFFVPAGQAAAFWQALAGQSGVVPAGDEAVEIRRMEAGIPWPGREITDEYLPAETGQTARAVSSNKGCYIGQEIVERMRSRGVVARRLVGLDVEGDVQPAPGAPLKDHSGTQVGKITSVCRSRERGTVMGLGYVRTESSRVGGRLETECAGRPSSATVVALPIAG